MRDRVFDLKIPQDSVSLAVFSSPHSGSAYPREFLKTSRLSRLDLRSSEDAFVDELFGAVPALGAPLLSARFPRAYVDVNRAASEIDPAMVTGVKSTGTNPRLAAGLGVIPRVVSDNRAIIDGKISLEEARARLESCYYPYHRMLRKLITERKTFLGGAILFDCHSMPHEALSSVPRVMGRSPEIVLGNRFGAASSGWIMDEACEAFRSEGFVVAKNAPFAGGYITRQYGNPREYTHAIQIEIDRSLYMDEARITPNADFEAIRQRLTEVARKLVQLGQRAMRYAAE